MSKIFYRAFNRFGLAKFAYGGQVLGLSIFEILSSKLSWSKVVRNRVVFYFVFIPKMSAFKWTGLRKSRQNQNDAGAQLTMMPCFVVKLIKGKEKTGLFCQPL